MTDANPAPRLRSGKTRFIEATRNFWLELKLSCFNLGYYRHLRRAPVGGGVRYFVALHAVLATLVFATFLPAIIGLPALARQFVTEKLPANVKVELKNGRLTTNLPADWTAEENGYVFGVSTLSGLTAPTVGPSTGSGKNITPGNWVVLAPDAVFMMDETTGLRVNELKGYADASFNRDQMLSWLAHSLPWWLVLVAVLAWLVAFGWLALLHATGVILLSWLALSYGRILGLRLTYAQWQNMGWRLATTPALVSVALLVAHVALPFTFTVVFVMFIMAVAADEKADPALT
jgi:hypothetical protein